MKKFEGVFTALATPFRQGEVDKASMRNLLKYQLENGVHGLVVNGTTGESPTLSEKEVENLFQFVKAETGGAVPLLVGTGGNSTEKTIQSSVAAQRWGADGLLIVTPYYNKPPQRGLVAHFKAVAQAVEVPIVLYNVPGRTAVTLSAEATIELSEVPNIIGVKDATADLELGKKIIDGTSEDFLVTSGDDFTFLDLAILGGKGVISVLSNIAPKITVDLLARARGGDTSPLQELLKLKELTELLFVEANPIPVKAALHLMGVFETDEMRLPLVPLAEKYCGPLTDELKKAGLHR